MSYVDFIYKEDEAIIEDGELKDFWECVDLRGNLGSPWRYGLPDLSRESLVNYLTHVAFYVTAWHEHVGTIVHYVLPPAKGMGLKIRPAKEENDVQVHTGWLAWLWVYSVFQSKSHSSFLASYKNDKKMKMTKTVHLF